MIIGTLDCCSGVDQERGLIKCSKIQSEVGEGGLALAEVVALFVPCLTSLGLDCEFHLHSLLTIEPTFKIIEKERSTSTFDSNSRTLTEGSRGSNFSTMR